MEENKHIPLPKRLEAIQNSLNAIATYILAKDKGNDEEIILAKIELDKIIK